MDLFFSASLLAAFLAGMAALFAPCCITVLLPAYLASAFRERKTILKMTFIFFFGVAAVLIPIGLGAAWLADIFQDFHRQLYIVGGSFMIILAVITLMGKNLPMIPRPKRWATVGPLDHPKSVFVLGLLSGAATSCCAPVLAGAVTLAITSGTFAKALAVTFAYVFGMTFPLFIAGYIYDRFQIDKSKIIRGRLVSVGSWSIHSTNLLAVVIFLVMGTTMVILGSTGSAFWAPTWQTAVGQTLNDLSSRLVVTLAGVPGIIWPIIVFGLFVGLVVTAWRRSHPSDNHDDQDDPSRFQ